MFDTPSHILREALLQKLDRNPSYSLRAFARDLGVSHAYLSLVMSGKKKLSPGSALRFGQVLDESTASRLVALAKESQWQSRVGAPSPSKKKCVDERVRLELDRFRALSDWYHLAILDLTTLANFQPVPRWIARKLGLKTAQVRIAVKRLVRLGLLEIDANRWSKTHRHLTIPTHGADTAIRVFHQGMIQKALEATQSPSLESYGGTDITGTTMAINPKRLPSAKTKIQNFRRSLARYLMRGECTELYQLNVQLFPLTRQVGKAKE